MNETAATVHLVDQSGVDDVMGASPAMLSLIETIDRVAASDVTVLVCGETGTGKELVARRIHRASARAAGPFIALNCAAVPEGLVESELFGHVRGAFTDARATRQGLLSVASGGTIFLDEIGELPLPVQSKLLRALQERRIRPVGADVEVTFEARVIAATNRDLDLEVAAGRFRSDLYYRVNVLSLFVPPLRDRGEDVLHLARHFLDLGAERQRKRITGFTEEASRRLLAYPWPGNVRELENCVEQALAFAAHDLIQEGDLPLRIRTYSGASRLRRSAPRRSTLEELERGYIAEILELVQGNKSEAARILGIDRKTLYRRLETYRIHDSSSATYRTAPTAPLPTQQKGQKRPV